MAPPGRARVRPCIHFVGFRGEEWWSAIKIWGWPDFVHRGWDRRAAREIAPGDVLIFAKGSDRHAPAERNFNDIDEACYDDEREGGIADEHDD